MRHKKLNQRFGRNQSARKALVRDLAKALLLNDSIVTTRTKAKEAKKLVERLISWAKKGALQNRRLAYKELCNHKLVSLLFNEIAHRFKHRVGGYARIYSLLDRRGDGASRVVFELTEKKELKPQKIKAEKKEKPLTSEEVGISEKTVQQQPPVEAEVKKVVLPVKEKPKYKETRPTKNFLGGLRKIFKKERDSL